MPLEKFLFTSSSAKCFPAHFTKITRKLAPYNRILLLNSIVCVHYVAVSGEAVNKLEKIVTSQCPVWFLHNFKLKSKIFSVKMIKRKMPHTKLKNSSKGADRSRNVKNRFNGTL